jgi:hypothetical protein
MEVIYQYRVDGESSWRDCPTETRFDKYKQDPNMETRTLYEVVHPSDAIKHLEEELKAAKYLGESDVLVSVAHLEAMLKAVTPEK